MIDIDLDAIRKRDTDWRDNGRDSNQTLACRDRHALLLHIKELEDLIEEVSSEFEQIKRIHRRHYQPKPPADPEIFPNPDTSVNLKR
jgi:hypothetical protein